MSVCVIPTENKYFFLLRKDIITKFYTIYSNSFFFYILRPNTFLFDMGNFLKKIIFYHLNKIQESDYVFEFYLSKKKTIKFD